MFGKERQMLAHIPYLRRRILRSRFQEELVLHCILRYVESYYFRPSASILVSLFWNLWLFVHFTRCWFSEGWQRFCSSRAYWEACEKLLPVCLIPYIHLAREGIHQRSMTMLSRSFYFNDSVHLWNCFILPALCGKLDMKLIRSFIQICLIPGRGWWGSSWGEKGWPRWEYWGNVLIMGCIPWINCLWNFEYWCDCLAACIFADCFVTWHILITEEEEEN